jgi:hypothetical protein
MVPIPGQRARAAPNVENMTRQSTKTPEEHLRRADPALRAVIDEVVREGARPAMPPVRSPARTPVEMHGQAAWMARPPAGAGWAFGPRWMFLPIGAFVIDFVLPMGVSI